MSITIQIDTQDVAEVLLTSNNKTITEKWGINYLLNFRLKHKH